MSPQHETEICRSQCWLRWRSHFWVSCLYSCKATRWWLNWCIWVNCSFNMWSYGCALHKINSVFMFNLLNMFIFKILKLFLRTKLNLDFFHKNDKRLMFRLFLLVLVINYSINKSSAYYVWNVFTWIWVWQTLVVHQKPFELFHDLYLSLLEVLMWSSDLVLLTCELMRRIVVFDPTSFSYPLVGAALKRSTASWASAIK